MNKQKGFTPLLIVLIIAAAIGGYFIYSGKINLPQKQVACTMDAKVCSDGTSVGRSGSKCEFTSCPAAKTDETVNWKTYTNTRYGYSIKYPNNWSGSSSDQNEALFAPQKSEGAPVGLSVINSDLSDQLDKREKELQDAGYITSIEEYEINNVSGKKLTFSKDGENGYDFFAEKDGYTYQFMGASGEFIQTGNQILSTFKFTQ